MEEPHGSLGSRGVAQETPNATGTEHLQHRGGAGKSYTGERVQWRHDDGTYTRVPE